MKRMTSWLTLIVAVALSVSVSGCLEDKVLDLILFSEAGAEFAQNSESINWTNTATVELGTQIDDALLENDLTRGDIKGATIMGVSYGATSFSQAHDWVIGGTIEVERLDVPSAAVTLLTYTDQSVQAALGQKIPAALTDAGVGLLQAALDEFLAGTADPMLRFTVNNGSVSPIPDQSDPIIFDWVAWLAIQITVSEEIEVLDPF